MTARIATSYAPNAPLGSTAYAKPPASTPSTGRNRERMVFPLLQQHPGAADLLAAQRAEEVWHQAIHQLEIRGQRRRVLLSVVENFFPVAFRVHRRAGAAVDEHELGPQDEALALHV